MTEIKGYIPPSWAEPWVCAYTPLAHLGLTLECALVSLGPLRVNPNVTVVCSTYVCISYTPPQVLAGTAEPSLAGKS